jgi:predicted AlkP superfamily pyrophosphatase or phosphodiesterase
MREEPSVESSRPLGFDLVDGLAAYAKLALPLLSQAVMEGRLKQFVVEASVPTISYPNYATIISGLDPKDHELIDNDHRRRLTSDHFFKRLHRDGMTSAVVGFHWWEDLLGGDLPPSKLYEGEDTPDHWVFEQAEVIATGLHPDFLLVHPMGVDWAGHVYGGQSSEYLAAATRIDREIHDFWKWWQLRMKGLLVIGADHGMGPGHHHDGNSLREQQVLYFVDSDGHPNVDLRRQSQVQNLLSMLMGEGV